MKLPDVIIDIMARKHWTWIPSSSPSSSIYVRMRQPNLKTTLRQMQLVLRTTIAIACRQTPAFNTRIYVWLCHTVLWRAGAAIRMCIGVGVPSILYFFFHLFCRVQPNRHRKYDKILFLFISRFCRCKLASQFCAAYCEGTTGIRKRN